MRFPFPPAIEQAAAGISPEPAPNQADACAGPFAEMATTARECSAEPRTYETPSNQAVGNSLPEFSEEQIAPAVQEIADAAALPSELNPDATVPFTPSPLPAPRANAHRKVIAFPRHLLTVPDEAYRLADPVVPNQPRILDVPEELEATRATPFLDGLEFDRNVQPQSPADHIELPFRQVTIARRIMAAGADNIVVALGSALFSAVVYEMIPGLRLSKPLLATAALVPAILWFAYQYLFLVYGGKTPGMCAAKIRLRTFQGIPPTARGRRNRVAGLCLSTLSLAMGLLWAFADVDGFCWHDRMSQTYLARD